MFRKQENRPHLPQRLRLHRKGSDDLIAKREVKESLIKQPLGLG